MPRYKPRVKAGPTLSHDPRDKLMAALNCYIGWNKNDPQYVRAPFYLDAVLKWRNDLSADNEDLFGTVITIYTTPRYGGDQIGPRCTTVRPPMRAWGQAGARPTRTRRAAIDATAASHRPPNAPASTPHARSA
jgi:hypothetical protein